MEELARFSIRPCLNGCYEGKAPGKCDDCKARIPVHYSVIVPSQHSSGYGYLRGVFKIDLQGGSILQLNVEFVLPPDAGGWYLPEGPCPPPLQLYAQLHQIFEYANIAYGPKVEQLYQIKLRPKKSSFVMGSSRKRRRRSRKLVVSIVSQLASSDDKTDAQRILDMVNNAANLLLKGSMMNVAKEMIRRSGDDSSGGHQPEWIAKVEDKAHLCEVHHANDGGFSGRLPCGNVACINCIIETAVQRQERCKCSSCGKPFKILPFHLDVSSKTFLLPS
ncbi:hypothetical protein IWW34DRAFT_641309 [Fusarium oxysporum f. sp. albedinis]|nr:hypothetical protein IWW34DRAFT_641309 [Fusarium oxysporum f. sp. albedinis]